MLGVLKKCSHCKALKPTSEFPANRSRRDGLGNECKVCKNERRRARSAEAKRAERLRWRENNREKRRAQKAAQKARYRGTLKMAGACEDCGAEGPLHGHHEDYERRLDVVWLCVACHNVRHRASGAEAA